MAANPGSLRRHLAGKQAARTRRFNNMVSMYGHPTYEDRPDYGVITENNSPQKQLTFIAGQPQYNTPPSPLNAKPQFGRSGKFVCPNCLERMSWGMKEEHNVFLCKNRQTIPAPLSTPASSEPSTNKDGITSPVITPTIAGQKSDTIRSGTIVPQFTIGDTVWVNGYGKCAIKTDRVKRTIDDLRVMQSGAFYKFAIGTGSTGAIFHWYPESRLTLISHATPVAAAAPGTQPTAKLPEYLQKLYDAAKEFAKNNPETPFEVSGRTKRNQENVIRSKSKYDADALVNLGLFKKAEPRWSSGGFCVGRYLFVAVAPATQMTPPNNDDDKDKFKIIHLRDFNIRTRPYIKHTKLIRDYCRSRKVIAYEEKESQLSPHKVGFTVLGKVPFAGHSQGQLTPAKTASTLAGTPGVQGHVSSQPKKQQSTPQSKTQGEKSLPPQSGTTATSDGTPPRTLI